MAFMYDVTLCELSKISQSISMGQIWMFYIIHVTFQEKHQTTNGYTQGYSLKKIMGSPKVPNHEILGAQHLSFCEKRKFFQSPKGIS